MANEALDYAQRRNKMQVVVSFSGRENGNCDQIDAFLI